MVEKDGPGRRSNAERGLDPTHSSKREVRPVSNGIHPAPPTSGLPCPSWCDLPAGHGFDSIDGDGSLWRAHQRVFRDFEFCDLDGNRFSVRVWMSEAQNASSDEGPVLGRLPLEITADRTEGLTGPQARQVAAALLDAADAWDEAQR